MPTHEIPGLIAKQDIENQKLEFQKLLDEWVSDDLHKYKLNAPPPHQQPYYGQPLPQNQQPQPLGEYIRKTRIPARTNFPSKSSGIDYSDALKSLSSYFDNRKSAFEQIIDTLFSNEDKVEYLKSMDYLIKEDNLWCYRVEGSDLQKTPQEVSKAFLREITIKFKNLLLTKQTLKLKF